MGAIPVAVIALSTLAALFVARVVAQLVQSVTTVDALPPFDAWQSGALPYPALLASQVAIVGAQALVIRAIAERRFSLAPGRRALLAALGAVYLVFMVFRLIAGLTFLDGDGWFDAFLPSVFHIVLAAFVLVTAWAGGRTA
ncbi:MAG: hypothetical protein AAGD35_22980 [Actinomycetota bacterium]